MSRLRPDSDARRPLRTVTVHRQVRWARGHMVFTKSCAACKGSGRQRRAVRGLRGKRPPGAQRGRGRAGAGRRRRRHAAADCRARPRRAAGRAQRRPVRGRARAAACGVPPRGRRSLAELADRGARSRAGRAHRRAVARRTLRLAIPPAPRGAAVHWPGAARRPATAGAATCSSISDSCCRRSSTSGRRS